MHIESGVPQTAYGAKRLLPQTRQLSSTVAFVDRPLPTVVGHAASVARLLHFSPRIVTR
jgi:hypothetical protein